MTIRVAISGASGLVGSALSFALRARGDNVTHLVRRVAARTGGEARWDPVSGRVDSDLLEGHDAVVHLAGEPLASWRWGGEKKERIRSSRVEGTRLLAEALAGLERPPAIMVCASAVGYYGSRPGEQLDETSEPGDGFLADVAVDWEAACEPASEAGIRVVNTRFGVIVDRDDALIARQLPLARVGLGGRVGNGRQHISWVATADVIRAILHVIDNPEIAGPVNVTSPNSVTNREFASALARAIGRPAFGWMPGLLAKLVFGEMGRELILTDQDARPARLLESGYEFVHPELETALRAALGSR
ncbi:MAG: TIGR01777 family oxidoreductase [Dehalococcoidia bacterium]|nr:TIGR01777 family oxidoreductase [Dehalococcoidia bacterium]